MTARSAGLLLYRRCAGEWEVFLIHPGGPYSVHKDAGAWSIPKGEIETDEAPLQAAQREFLEETGKRVDGPFLELVPIQQRSGKWVLAWAAEGEFDPSQLHSNLFSIEWPPHSGTMQQFPEADRGAWFALDEARVKMIAGQQQLLDQLQQRLTRRTD